MIRKAKNGEIPQILSITKACASNMKSKNIFQWNEHYPSFEAFQNDFLSSELYVYSYQDSIIGCITITPKMDEEYFPISWLSENQNNLYVHRLAVHPDYQGNGYAQQLMDYAENFAQLNNYTSIRLDTFSQNKRNQQFYERRGYTRLGSIFFPKQSEHPFYCYERLCKK